MKQKVKIYGTHGYGDTRQNVEDKINAEIRDGWEVKSIKTNESSIIVLFEREF